MDDGHHKKGYLLEVEGADVDESLIYNNVIIGVCEWRVKPKVRHSTSIIVKQ